MKTKKTNFFRQIFWTKSFLLFFAVFFFLFLINFSEARAEDPKGSCTFSETTHVDGVDLSVEVTKNEVNVTKEECEALGKKSGSTGRWFPNGSEQAKKIAEQKRNEEELISGSDCSWIFHPLDCSLLAIVRFLASLVSMAATLFTWIVEPAVFKSIVDSSIIYGIWAMVKNSLNIAFILMLLFSAFATVFQVDKYNYKNVLVKLIIMALLVNFSFPITRVIIDFSNSLMYYFLSMMSGGIGHSFPDILNSGGLGTIINESEKQVGTTNGTAFLIGVTIFLFIFMITVLAIAVLMVIRAITLAILVIFSSVAFVGPVVPPLSQHAGKWWSALFSNAFFGPAMIFMLYIALTMMGGISGALRQSESKVSVVTVAGSFSDFSQLVAAMAISSLPIIILWIGIGMAKTMGAVGADAVIGKATSWGKQLANWGTRKPAKFIARATGAATLAAGVAGGVKKRWDNSMFGKEATDKRKGKVSDYIYRKTGGKVDSEQEMKKKAKEYEDQKIGEEELKKRAMAGDSAAAYSLSKDNKMDAETYQSFMNKNTDARAEKEIKSNVKKTRADIVALHEYKKKYDAINSRRLTIEEEDDFMKSHPDMTGRTEEEIKKEFAKQEAQKEANDIFEDLDFESWKNQDWKKLSRENASRNDNEKETIRLAVSKSYGDKSESNREKLKDAISSNKWAGMQGVISQS